MAQSKYAGLPGIDDEGQDVYETTDLPEVDQRAGRFADTDLSDSVTVLPVNARDAFGHFVTQSGSVKMLSNQDGDSNGASGETLIEKYRRLQRETDELAEVVGKLKDVPPKQGGADFGSSTNPSEMLSDLNAISKRINSLQIDSWLSLVPENAPKTADEVEKVLDSAAQKPVPGNPSVIYEVYSRPKENTLEQQARLASLDERMTRLEGVLRCDDKQLSLLRGIDGGSGSGQHHKSLVESVQDLQAKVASLSGHNLEAIDARLTSLLHKLNQISERRVHSESAERIKRIDELYEAFVATEYPNLQVILSKLTTLAGLHQKANDFSACLTHISGLQGDLVESMKTNESELANLREAMTSNMDAIKSIVSGFEGRMEKLTK